MIANDKIVEIKKGKVSITTKRVICLDLTDFKTWEECNK